MQQLSVLVVLVLGLVAASVAVYPLNFIVDTVSPLDVNTTTRYYLDSEQGVVIDHLVNENVHKRVVFDTKAQKHYIIFNYLMGSPLTSPLCFLSHWYTPPLLPILDHQIAIGAVNNNPVDVWVDSNADFWTYTVNVSGYSFPILTTTITNRIHQYSNLKLKSAPKDLFNLPQCFTPQPVAKRDVETVLPSFPPSFTYSHKTLEYTETVIVDSPNKRSVTSRTYTTKADTIWKTVRMDNRRLRFSDSLGINPTPCTEHFEPSVAPWPAMTYIGHLDDAAIGSLMLFSSGARVYVLLDTSTLLAVFENDDLTYYYNFSPINIIDSMFTIPAVCYRVDFYKKREETMHIPTEKSSFAAPPALPPSLTIFFDEHDGSTTVTYRSVAGKIRFDAIRNFPSPNFAVSTIVQLSNRHYRFGHLYSSPITLNPVPCEFVNTSVPAFGEPQFQYFMGNATVGNTPAELWMGFIPGFVDIEYWYFAADGTPLYTFGDMGFKRVSYWFPQEPPPGVFDLAGGCRLVS